MRTLERDDRVLPVLSRAARWVGKRPPPTGSRAMVDLDPEQRDVLLWILDEGSGEVVLAPVGGSEVDLVIRRGPRRRVAERDVARLVDLLLLEHVQRKVYRVTELGREAVRPHIQPAAAPAGLPARRRPRGARAAPRGLGAYAEGGPAAQAFGVMPTRNGPKRRNVSRSREAPWRSRRCCRSGGGRPPSRRAGRPTRRPGARRNRPTPRPACCRS